MDVNINWESKYPFGRIPPKLDDCGCILPIIAKYAVYAEASAQNKVSDRMVDDLYDTAKELALKIHPQIFINLDKPELVQQIINAKNRLDKVIAIESLISLQHESGSILQFACDYDGIRRGQRLPDNILYQQTISDVVLHLLSGNMQNQPETKKLKKLSEKEYIREMKLLREKYPYPEYSASDIHRMMREKGFAEPEDNEEDEDEDTSENEMDAETEVIGYKTAISRTVPPEPLTYLKDNALLKGRLLDYGSGRGCWYGMECYDPYYKPDFPQGSFDTITCNYVLNVIPLSQEIDVIESVRCLLKPDGYAYFAVRRDLPPCGKEGKDTFQRFVTLPFESISKNNTREIYRMSKGSIYKMNNVNLELDTQNLKAWWDEQYYEISDLGEKVPCVIRTSEALDEAVKHLGYRSKTVPDDVINSVKGIIKTDTDLITESQERLKDVQKVPDSDLSPTQLANLNLAKAVAEAITFGTHRGPFAAIIPPASDRTRTAGLYSRATKEQFISREQLYHAKSAIETTIHESSHHTSGREDGDPALAAEISKNAAKIIKLAQMGAFDKYISNPDFKW
jgi:SAM-dependent methyltransferase